MGTHRGSRRSHPVQPGGHATRTALAEEGRRAPDRGGGGQKPPPVRRGQQRRRCRGPPRRDRTSRGRQSGE
eukprot:14639274-Heterocapsa_arctica.AAC.2